MPDAFEASEVHSASTDQMLHAVELKEFFNVCPVAG
jgi:hypothetical protein